MGCVALFGLSRGARGTRRSWLVLAGGMLLLSVSDTVWAYSTIGGAFESGSPIDLAWIAGYLMIGLAARVPAAPRSTTMAATEGWTAFVPYVPFPLVIATAAYNVVQDGPIDGVGLITGFGSFALLLLRQVIAIRENHRLALELERRVDERTAALAKSEALFREVGNAISDAVALLGADLRVQYTSPGLQRIGGYADGALDGTIALQLVHRDDYRTVIPLADEVLATPGLTRVIRCRVRRADGSYGHAELTMSNLLEHPELNGYLIAIKDVSGQRELEDTLRHRAEHDDLTGLLNRSAVVEHLRVRMEGGSAASVLLLDLDGFKGVNDSLGHAAGDQLLVAVAARLRGAVRPDDLVARLGGDEFAIVVSGAIADAAVLATRILRAFDEPVLVRGRGVQVRTSIGVASMGEAADDLLRNADVAMYAAKAAGRNRVEVFHEGMRDRLLRRLTLEDALNGVVGRGELRLVYQPLVDLQTGQLLGAEALLRWRHDGLDVEPMEFIPIAEETGAITEIGRWVLHQACADAAIWQALRPDGPLARVAVNVSVRQLVDGDIVADVADALQASGLAPCSLTLELTESAVMEHSEDVVAKLHAVRALGARLSIDDFGTGYSSLGRLKFLPVDEVKIDQSFVGVLTDERDPAPVCEAVIALGRSMRLDVVAEGIEEVGQLRAMQARGCPVGQGYLFGNGLSNDEVERMVLVGTVDLANRALNFPV
jgi:diguanylate cyclase (GGDEF)-like protein/PAS domain S-box-containing protein